MRWNKSADLLVLEAQLGRVVNVLILAAAAIREITAQRLDPFRRRLHNPQQPRARKTFFHLGDFRFHHLAHHHERDKDDKIFQPSHPFAAEGNIINRSRCNG